MNALTAHEILAKSLPGSSNAFQPGRIETASRRVAAPEEALAAFRDFGGEGWLQIAEDEEIVVFSSALAEASGWPVAGEASREDASLLLVREEEGWTLVESRRQPPANDDDLIAVTEFRRRDAEGKLRYETHWTAVEVYGQTEIRPVAYRFAGFSTGRKEDRA